MMNKEVDKCYDVYKSPVFKSICFAIKCCIQRYLDECKTTLLIFESVVCWQRMWVLACNLMNTVDLIRAIAVIITVTMQLSKTTKFSQSYHNFYKILKSDWLLTILISALIGQCK